MKHSNIIDAIRDQADRHADRPAIIDPAGVWTHAQLYDRVDRLSNAFQSLGLCKGDRLLAWLPNAHEAIETELACIQCGGVWVTLHAALTWPEVSTVIKGTDPRIAVVDRALLDKIPEDLCESADSMRACSLVAVGERGAATTDKRFAARLDYEDIVANSEPKRPDVPLTPDDLVRLRYTSGTTGNLKAAMLSHRAYLGSLRILQDELPPLTPDDRVLHAAPLTHASAAYLYPLLAAGGANVILPRFDAEEVLATIERERVTVMFTVPTMLHRLSNAAGFHRRDLSSLRSVSYGGAPTPPDILQPWIEAFDAIMLHIYGMTEALHPVTTLHRDEHRPENHKLGSIGKPTEGCDVEVRDDGGSALSDGDIGELWVRGPVAMDGYWHAPEASAEVMRDGWIATGDLGFRDADGYLWIVDRKKDVIISGGMNVYSSEIEAVLASHADIAEAAVVGMPHPDWGEIVHAVIVPKGDHAPSELELLDFCRERLAGYKRPKAVSIFSSALPRTGSGKILKPEIIRLLNDSGITN